MKRTLYLLAAGTFAVLLFVGPAGADAPRSVRHAWDFGHIICFFLWGRLLLNYWPRLRDLGFERQAVAILLFSLLVGGGVEILQGALGRNPDLGDVGRDLVGGLLALAFVARKPKLLPGLDGILKLLSVVLLLYCLSPTVVSLADEFLARRGFPVLADFETPFERERWSGRSLRRVVDEFAAHGRSSLRVELVPARYSGLSSSYLPSDWRGYHAIAFDIYNPSGIPLKMNCRIDDRQHAERGYVSDDRFSRSFVAAPGWTEISFSVKEVVHAPSERVMDIEQIAAFMIFAVDVQQTQVFYFDNLRLVRD